MKYLGVKYLFEHLCLASNFVTTDDNEARKPIIILYLCSLGDYAYQGDKLRIINSDIVIECLNDKYVVTKNEEQTEYSIKQLDGIDIEDRIEKGRQIIKEILNDKLRK